jgi:hypothetical protein
MEQNPDSKDNGSHAAAAVVRSFVQAYFKWTQVLSARYASDEPVDLVQESQEYGSIAVQFLASNWVAGAREAFRLYDSDDVSSETIERVEFPSPQTACVFTRDPGPPDDERWRYEVIVENGEWRIARKFQIEFDGKPWDNEEIL